MAIEFFNRYLDKHRFKPVIDRFPDLNLATVIVIPCYNEPDIIDTLNSLYKCNRPFGSVEVVVVANYPDGSEEPVVNFHNQTVKNLNSWSLKNIDDLFTCHIINAPSLPKKFAGVGLARKIGMDEAIYRFSLINNENGIIYGFDADSTVEKNYLAEIEAHFNKHPKTPGASIYFEHPLDDIEDIRLKDGIIQYEAHLRYLVQAIRYTGFPYSFHTVGSSFAVKAKAYVKQGGMNKFKAGEDFYFINKIIPLGNYTEINTTRVNPQARISGRVPFGTGASMIKWMEGEELEFLTYQFSLFLPLKMLFGSLEIIFDQKCIPDNLIKDKALVQFLQENGSAKAIQEIFENSSSYTAFAKRFYGWFDAFKIVKYLNFSSAGFYPRKPIIEEGEKLIKVYKSSVTLNSHTELLEFYRKWDRLGLEKI